MVWQGRCAPSAFWVSNMHKQKFKRRFIINTFTRFHMFLILSGTILAGVVFSKLLLIAGLNNMMVRFALVLVLAYLSFFVLMRLWLSYLTRPYRREKSGDPLVDVADAASGFIDGTSSSGEPAYQGGGGAFGGGGASGGYDAVGDSVDVPLSDAAIESSGSIGDLSDGDLSGGGLSGDSAADAISGFADEGGLLLIPLILLLAVVLGGGIYLIYEAPVIISEAAFELVLATTIVKKARQIDQPDWVGSVFRATWPALLVTLVITILTGWGLSAYCPEASKIREVVEFCL